MTKHAYLPTKIISVTESAFLSLAIKDVIAILGFTLKHATTNQVKTVGMVEHSQESIKQALKIETGERR